MAGEIGTLNVTMSILAQISAAYDTNTLTGNTGLTSGLVVGASQNWQNTTSLPSGAALANQAKYFVTTTAASGTTTINLISASANLANDATATFDNVGGILMWLPTITQIPALALTAQASSVTIGNAGSNIAQLFFGSSTGTIQLYPGDILACSRTNALYWALSASHENLLVTNNDSVNASNLVIFLVGKDN